MIARTKRLFFVSCQIGAVVGCSLMLMMNGCGDATFSAGQDAAADGAGQPSRTGGASGTGGAFGMGGGSATGPQDAGDVASSGGVMGSGGTRGSGGVMGSGGSPVGPDAGADAGSDAGSTLGADAGSQATGVVAAGVRWIGRVDTTNPLRPRFAWSGTGFVARFSGTSLALQINNSGSASFIFKTVVDGVPRPALSVVTGQATINLASGLAAGVHTVEVYRQTEGSQGDSQFLGLTVGGGVLMDPPAPPGRLIEVVGDSISCGYGTLGSLADLNCFATESHWDSFDALAARALGAELSTVAISGQGVVRNFGGDMVNTLPMVYGRALTNDATPLWDFQAQPQVVVINLGTNDISNNKGDPGVVFRNTYLAFVQTVRARYPNAMIVCMIGPLLSGTDLATIRGYISSVVGMRNAAGDTHIEFFDRITTQTADKAACASHPNPTENQIMADLLVVELKARLGW